MDAPSAQRHAGQESCAGLDFVVVIPLSKWNQLILIFRVRSGMLKLDAANNTPSLNKHVHAQTLAFINLDDTMCSRR